MPFISISPLPLSPLLSHRSSLIASLSPLLSPLPFSLLLFLFPHSSFSPPADLPPTIYPKLPFLSLPFLRSTSPLLVPGFSFLRRSISSLRRSTSAAAVVFRRSTSSFLAAEDFFLSFLDGLLTLGDELLAGDRRYFFFSGPSGDFWSGSSQIVII